MNLDFVIANSFGVVRTAQLSRCGLDRDEITRLLMTKRLFRVRHGWLASDSAAPAALAAVKGGGVLSCVSALALRGYWTPRTPHTHVRLTDFARRATAGGLGSGLHRCGSRGDSRRPATSVDSTLIALSTAVACVSDEELVAIIDSVLQTRRVSEDDVRAALAGHPAKVRRLLDRVDARAESGSESLARYRLARLRLNVRPQVRISGVGRVDLLVGERLVIEVDSRAHHTGEVAYESDRRRDRLLVERDYVVIRVSYNQVLNEWNDIERSVLAVVRRRDHLRRSHTRNLSSRATG